MLMAAPAHSTGYNKTGQPNMRDKMTAFVYLSFRLELKQSGIELNGEGRYWRLIISAFFFNCFLWTAGLQASVSQCTKPRSATFGLLLSVYII